MTGAAILPALILLSHGPVRVSSTMRRYPAGATLCLAAWAVATLAISLSGRALAWYDVIAGLLLLLAMLWAAFVFWTLICWGVTTSLLQALTRFSEPVDIDTWFREYSGGADIEAFARDRASVLTGSGLACWKGGAVFLSGARGLWLTRAARALWRLYGVREDD